MESHQHPSRRDGLAIGEAMPRAEAGFMGKPLSGPNSGKAHIPAGF